LVGTLYKGKVPHMVHLPKDALLGDEYAVGNTLWIWTLRSSGSVAWADWVDP